MVPWKNKNLRKKIARRQYNKKVKRYFHWQETDHSSFP